jgi:hypothetical protein
MERDWIDYTNAASGIATVIGLLVVFIKEWRTRNDLEDLTDVVKEMQQQNQLLSQQNSMQGKKLKVEAKPDFQPPRTHISTEGEFRLFIDNIGQRAKNIRTVTPRKNDVEILVYDKVVDKGKCITVNTKRKSDKAIKDSEYYFLILYSDIHDNGYQTIISGKGANVTFFLTLDDDHFDNEPIIDLG